jgi:hypothetical protein
VTVVRDAIVLTVPRDLVDNEQLLIETLLDIGLRQVRETACPGTVVMDQDWQVTNDPDRLAAWEMPHVCATCVEGQLQGIEYLRKNPGGYVAFATVVYDQPEPIRIQAQR